MKKNKLKAGTESLICTKSFNTFLLKHIASMCGVCSWRNLSKSAYYAPDVA